MHNLPTLLKCDAYKTGHIYQQPKGVTKIFSNLTPRSTKHFMPDNQEDFKGILVFGIQAFIKKYLIDEFNEFFETPKDIVLNTYKNFTDSVLGKDSVKTDHIEALHDLGYLPLEIKALPEGYLTKAQIPILTMTNTHDDFAWLVGYLEDLVSNSLWKIITTATTAFHYRLLFEKFGLETSTCSNRSFIDFQGHDFSLRGMSGMDDGSWSGMGHLAVFKGSDNLPAIFNINKYYNYYDEKFTDTGYSIPATEHSVTCMNISYNSEDVREGEKQFLKRLLTEVYPNGLFSFVSDTNDYYDTIKNKTLELKSEIMQRNGKVVFRPDSGIPADIICGQNNEKETSSLDILAKNFGYHENDYGYKVIDSHVGLIYGDAITYSTAKEILQRMKDKGYSSENIVLGIGSFTYQHVTRDTLGFAVKATAAEIDNKTYKLQKNPKTDSGKKSATGYMVVEFVGRDYKLIDNLNYDEYLEFQLHPTNQFTALGQVFYNGVINRYCPLLEIRSRISEQINHFIN